MLEILNILYKHPSIELFVLSGFFSKTSGGFVSVDSKMEFQKLNIDKAFVGCSGIDINKGWLSTHSMVEGEFKKVAIEHSKESYIILESNKFDTYDLYNFISIDKISNVISTLEENDNRKLLLEELDIKVF
jgi:DeoR/GlpR family transcriptional regulator of sugar metabolism